MNKALVIGGTGFLGRYLVQELLENGVAVSVLCRNKSAFWKDMGVEFYYGSITDQSIVDASVAGNDCVFHLAAKAGVWGAYDEYYAPNVLGTENVINSCLKHKVPKLIYTSTPSIVTYKKPIRNGDEDLKMPTAYYNNYQRTKKIAERKVLEANSDAFQTVSIRPQAIWGIGDTHIFPRILKKLKKGKLKIIGTGHTKTSISFVKNVAWAHFLASKAAHIGGNAYFINDEKEVDLWGWIDECAQSIHCKLPQKKISKKLAFSIATMLELCYKIAHISSDPPFTRYTVSKVSTDYYFSISKAKKDFGYFEKYDIHKGKEEFKKHLQETF